MLLYTDYQLLNRHKYKYFSLLFEVYFTKNGLLKLINWGGTWGEKWTLKYINGYLLWAARYSGVNITYLSSKIHKLVSSYF